MPDNKLHTGLTNETFLLQRCVEGDRQAFTEIYTYYAPLLYKAVYPLTNRSKEDAEEIIQEIFVGIWDKREKLMTIRSFRPFVFRIARNRVIDWFRRNETRKEYANLYKNLPKTEEASLSDDLLFAEYHTIAMQAIAQLTDRQREVFNLRHTEDLSIAEIAEKLGISIPAVKKHLYESTRFIKDYLREHGDWVAFLLILALF